MTAASLPLAAANPGGAAPANLAVTQLLSDPSTPQEERALDGPAASLKANLRPGTDGLVSDYTLVVKRRAVAAATGTRIYDLPITPERVWRALKSRQEPATEETWKRSGRRWVISCSPW